MREYSANERKLMKVSNSPWFNRSMALFWIIIAISDYRTHRFSWLDGFLVGAWSVLTLIELIMSGMGRRRKNATH